MSPEERAALESETDRALRRGDFAGALTSLSRVASAFPFDQAIAAKLANIRENLQDGELTSPKARQAVPSSPRPGSTQGGLDEAEVLAARGDYAGAITLYRKALAAKPDADLLKERLAELFRLVQAQAPRKMPGAPVSKEVLLGELLSRIDTRKKA